jgi:exonuclease III
MFIIQYNINGLNTNICDLELLISKHNPEIVVLQETRNKNPNYSNTKKGYNCIIPYDSTGTGSVGFLIKNGIPYEIPDLPEIHHLFGVKIKHPSGQSP